MTRWQVKSARAGSAEAAQLMFAGWEPFAVTVVPDIAGPFHVVWLRRAEEK